MTASLALADRQTAADLRTFVSRARQIDDGGIRLAVTGPVLVATVCVLRPPGLGESGPTVLGLRTMTLTDDGSDGLDVTVPLSAVGDRLARADDAVEPAAGAPSTAWRLPVPPTTLKEAWAGIAAPRRGWERVGALPLSLLREAARLGVDEVRSALPADPGSALVHTVRRAVLARPLIEVLSPPDAGSSSGVSDAVVAEAVPIAAAYAAELLGFLPSAAHGDDATVFAHARWLRLSTAGGHVLVKR